VLADSNRITAVGALLLPVALMLGFLLNTAIWFCLNDRCRDWADRTMDGTSGMPEPRWKAMHASRSGR
jgi:hypothetical protein